MKKDEIAVIRQIAREEIAAWWKAKQNDCKHVEGVLHKDGRVTCKQCDHETTPPYANL